MEEKLKAEREAANEKERRDKLAEEAKKLQQVKVMELEEIIERIRAMGPVDPNPVTSEEIRAAELDDADLATLNGRKAAAFSEALAASARRVYTCM